MGSKIKQLSIENLDQVIQVASLVLQTCFNYYSPEIKQKIIEEDLDIETRLSAPVFITFGAFLDDRLVGFVSGLVPMGGVGDVHWLMILKEFQGKGIGSALIKEFIRVTRSQGAHAVHLFSEKVNVPFYKRLGFEQVGLVKRSYYDHDEYFMNKILS